MKELQFIASRQHEWAAWDHWLRTGSHSSSRKAREEKAAAEDDTVQPMAIADLPAAYRRLCRDLSLARDRHYSSALVHALHDRVLAAHQRVYGARKRVAGAWLEFIASGFPRLVRQEAGFVLAAAALFFIPLLLSLALLQIYPDGVYLVLSSDSAAQYEEMYAPDAQRLGRPAAHGAARELSMLAFYISNNVRIDFQCFAGGIAFGLGSLFFLGYNGLMIGATAGHLTQLGYIETFWGFVAGHSAPELIGAVLSGAAGLKIGLALIAPGRKRRLDALKQAAHPAIRLLYGAAALTFSAAFIEALWSPNRALPFAVKIGTGIAVWLLLLAYLLFAGRGSRAA
ncbi:stage II sporulation protein M [Propionivibrio limicola]|uniref:stage II sporulation protein M n=1 Tax=Propionivibrio limicola TaxID=167645 RepID=UPI001290DA18|nr:stage II sporulation protein M [Propionivibrio limicola]